MKIISNPIIIKDLEVRIVKHTPNLMLVHEFQHFKSQVNYYCGLKETFEDLLKCYHMYTLEYNKDYTPSMAPLNHVPPGTWETIGTGAIVGQDTYAGRWANIQELSRFKPPQQLWTYNNSYHDRHYVEIRYLGISPELRNMGLSSVIRDKIYADYHRSNIYSVVKVDNYVITNTSHKYGMIAKGSPFRLKEGGNLLQLFSKEFQ